MFIARWLCALYVLFPETLEAPQGSMYPLHCFAEEGAEEQRGQVFTQDHTPPK